jgi:chromosome partitioning related protein ParA
MERLKDSKQMAALIRDECKKVEHRIGALDTTIPSTKAFKEATSLQMPVHRYEYSKRDPNSQTAYEIMHMLAWELMPNFTGTYASWRGAPPIDVADTGNGNRVVLLTNRDIKAGQ